MTVSPSTVRAELAELERLGLLTHPHTSAGACRPRPATGSTPTLCSNGSSRARARSRSTSPQPEASSSPRCRRRPRRSRRRRVCSRSSPRRLSRRRRCATSRCSSSSRRSLMVVVITSTGGVSKRVLALSEPVDTGLTLWAGDYLNDQLAGLELGSTALRRRLEDPGLSPAGTRVPGAAAACVHGPHGRAGPAPLRRRRCEPPQRGACRRARGVPTPVGGAREARGDPRDARRDARLAPALRPRRRGAREPRAPRGLARRRLVRPLDANPRSREPARAAADGLREGDPLRPRRRPRALALRRSPSTKTTSLGLPGDGGDGSRLLRDPRRRPLGARRRDQARLQAARARGPSGRLGRA